MQSSTITVSTVVKAIIGALEQNLNVVTQAAKDAHFAATHSESVAESKYDTFGLESSYLAQGQQKRVEQVNEALVYFSQLPTPLNPSVPDGCQKIELLNLVSLRSGSLTRHFFVAPHSGGLTVEVAGHSVIVVTAETPVGQKLLGKMIDDEVSIMVKGVPIAFDVVNIG